MHKVFLLRLITFATVISLIGGCISEVRTPPPPAKVETVPPSPYHDAVWIQGYWQHGQGGWVWVPGHWGKRPRPHADWAPGHWEKTYRGWRWTPGHWR